MIASAVLGIGILGLTASLGKIQKAIQTSKNMTLASNLAQEKMQILKQKNYYQVLVTTSPSYETSFTPNIPYDTTYFPMETITEGGVTYRRLTYIEVVQDIGGVLTVLPPTTPDTGLKLIHISVIWNAEGTPRKLQIKSVLSNPDTVMSNSAFTGVVTDNGTAAPISGATINIAENVGWRATSDANGNYLINLVPGNFTMVASAPGYFSQYRPVSLPPNTTQSQNFSLVRMASGTVTGIAWTNDHLVISQVVASTVQTGMNPYGTDYNGFSAEYVELFNPTTYTFNIGGISATPDIKLNFQSPSGCTNAHTCADATYGIKLVYVSTMIHPGHYYVIANTSTFVINGSTVVADAYYADNADTYCSVAPNGANWNLAASPPLRHLTNVNHGGVFWISDLSGRIHDAVGWSHNANQPPNCETSCYNLTTLGLRDGEQLVRISSPLASPYSIDNFGRSYDSGQNAWDIAFATFSVFAYSPRATYASSVAVVSGTPAANAVVSSVDGLSASTVAVLQGNPPVAYFALTQVATGTWTVFLSSGNAYLQHTTVTIAASGSVYSFPSSMTFLTDQNTSGFIAGRVTDVLGAAINPAITVSANGAGPDTTANTLTGRFLLSVVPGIVDVTANPGGVGNNPSYVTQASNTITVGLGEVHSGVNFTLSQGGRISGFVTRDGINALPGVTINIADSNSVSRDVPVSGSDGRFTSVVLSTGIYEISPAIGSLETSSPTAVSRTVTMGATVFSATFTITGALGAITGSVTAGGQPIRTGVLIVATTGTFAGAPPAPPSLSTASLTSSAIYATSSGEDGTYHLEVRHSTNPAYRVYAYYTTFSAGSPTINSITNTGVQVTAGATTSGVNFAW